MSCNTSKHLIAGGNATVLIHDCLDADRACETARWLKEVEQVGFVTTTSSPPELSMMGNELCINATLAFASSLGQGGWLKTSGLNDPIPYSNGNGLTSVTFPAHYEQHGNVVLLEGIGYILFDSADKSSFEKPELQELCKKHSLPAFGGIVCRENQITPYLYVAEVDSFVKETACGSGSVACSIWTGAREVIQPTGEVILVDKDEGFAVSAKVTELV